MEHLWLNPPLQRSFLFVAVIYIVIVIVIVIIATSGFGCIISYNIIIQRFRKATIIFYKYRFQCHKNRSNKTHSKNADTSASVTFDFDVWRWPYVKVNKSTKGIIWAIYRIWFWSNTRELKSTVRYRKLTENNKKNGYNINLTLIFDRRTPISIGSDLVRWATM